MTDEIDSDILIPDHILEEYFRLQNRANDYLNQYIRNYRKEQITQLNNDNQ